MALYQISPSLSGIMFVIVPTVILIGTSIGSILRQLSKMAQAQTAKAMAVGEEAISNVRTVRSFAMEEYEMDRYGKEVNKAREMNEWLGMGIGKSCENFVRKRVLVNYQFQCEVIKVMLSFHTFEKTLNFENSFFEKRYSLITSL